MNYQWQEQEAKSGKWLGMAVECDTLCQGPDNFEEGKGDNKSTFGRGEVINYHFIHVHLGAIGGEVI